jgi:hypothetical protein
VLLLGGSDVRTSSGAIGGGGGDAVPIRFSCLHVAMFASLMDTRSGLFCRGTAASTAARSDDSVRV